MFVLVVSFLFLLLVTLVKCLPTKQAYPRRCPCWRAVGRFPFAREGGTAAGSSFSGRRGRWAGRGGSSCPADRCGPAGRSRSRGGSCPHSTQGGTVAVILPQPRRQCGLVVKNKLKQKKLHAGQRLNSPGLSVILICWWVEFLHVVVSHLTLCNWGGELVFL